MKKMLVVLLTVALILSLAACTKAPERGSGSTGETTATITETTTTPTSTNPTTTFPVVQEREDWMDNLPRMNGSTSTIPLEAGIRAALLGISFDEAELQVSHSTTYGSFYDLIYGVSDLVFSVPLSETQLQEAKDNGVELDMTAIAAEGFVFVVNAKNPVDTLTQQQLRDIYSGKIKNWKEVGGNDAPIVAYQRNETSGSQNFMHTFMDNTPLMDPLTTAQRVPNSMGALMDAVAYYDNAENAIGYSVYAYAADMYGNGNEIKFIHVDGVKPSKATMADGSYPLLGYNYAVYRKDTPADASLRKLVDWIVSDEGQRAVQAAGYVPLRPMGTIAETEIRLYKAVGTGPAKPADYVPSFYRFVVDRDPIDGSLWLGYGERVIAAIKDEATRALVQEFCETSHNEIESAAPNKEWSRSINIRCINGYLEVNATSRTTEQEIQNQTKGTRKAVFDLIAGKRIISSDLFFKGEDFVTALNALLREQVGHVGETDPYTEGSDLKREFIGLPADTTVFGLQEITLTEGNPYYRSSCQLPLEGMYTYSVLSIPRDMRDLFDDTVTVRQEFVIEDGFDIKEKLVMDGLYAELLSPAHYPAAICEKVNAGVREHCQARMSREAVENWWKATLGDYSMGSEGAWVEMDIFGAHYARFQGLTFFYTPDNWDACTEYGMTVFYDLTTGEEVPFTTFFKEGWEQHSGWYADDYLYSGADIATDKTNPIAVPDLSKASLYRFGVYAGGIRLSLGFLDPNMPLVTVEVPEEYVNWG